MLLRNHNSVANDLCKERTLGLKDKCVKNKHKKTNIEEPESVSGGIPTLFSFQSVHLTNPLDTFTFTMNFFFSGRKFTET